MTTPAPCARRVLAASAALAVILAAVPVLAQQAAQTEAPAAATHPVAGTPEGA